MQKEFSFHACLGPETSQADVMALCGIQQLLDAALAGYHVTIFAYGQTGGARCSSALQHSVCSPEECLAPQWWHSLAPATMRCLRMHQHSL
jgi:hypothetical protein